MTVRGDRRERGTTTLEVAGMAPLVVLFVMILAQVALTLYGITTAQTAARQGARAFAQGHDPAPYVRASVPRWMEVQTRTFGTDHGVRAIVDVPDLVPFFDVTITRETVMP